MPRSMILQRVFAIACLFGLIGLSCRDGQNDEAGNPNSTHEAHDSLDAVDTPHGCIDRAVRIAVASSLREPSLSLKQHLRSQEPRVEVELIFGASSALARQLAQGAPIDVFVSADAEIVDDLVERKILVDESKLEFARGRLSLVATPGWANGASGLSALESEHLRRLAIPSAAVPLGRYARAWLSSRGLLEGLTGKIVVTEHARATLAAIDSGLVDLAIIYRSDLRLAKRASEILAIDPSEYPPIRYVAARAAGAPGCPEIDEAVVAWGQPSLQDELASAGFLIADSVGALQ